MYAELVCSSAFSFLRGASHPFELVRRAKELGYAALTLTDECSLAGIVRAHEVAEEVGLKLIIGSQFRFPDGEDRVVLLAPDAEAYTQLCALITQARRAARKGSYRVARADFDVAVDRCIGIWLPREAAPDSAAEWFGRLRLSQAYVGYTHLVAQDSEERLRDCLALGARLGRAVVAVGDVHYHMRTRRQLHDVLTAVRLGTTVQQLGRRGFANGEQHLRPLSTLRKLYPAELLERSCQIAASCGFSLADLRYRYPVELVPAGRTATEHLRELTYAGAARRWPAGLRADVRDLIEKELALIAELGYEHYFLTVEDICRFARERGILCQGRGSAANSAVCYALEITAVDPERASMLFERFLSRERREPPDIDVDFEHQRREEVIQYIYRTYGRHRAALTATVICYRAKMAVRDVGKALGLPLDVVNRLSTSLQWFDDDEALRRLLEGLGFDPRSLLVQQLRALGAELQGMPRHLSQHVGGFVISDLPLHTLVPVENAAMADRTIIQWDKDDLDALGLLKIDVLALGMLSAVRRALDMVSRWRAAPFRLQDIPAEDPATYAMLCAADAVGVFQVESRAQQSMLPRLRPRTFYDLVVEVAIIRPGPIQGGMVHPYLRRRMGREPVPSLGAALDKVLGRTYGVPIFQEQVMQVAIEAAGFSPGEADQVRRSMAAWQRKGGLEQFRERLRAGMQARGYTDAFAEQIYQQVLGFGSYGFPESHAASFALITYASAWLKCHEPAAFVAGLLNSLPMGFYAAAQLVADARRHDVAFLPVDVAISDWDCELESVAGTAAPAVRLGLRMVVGLAESEAAHILQARAAAQFDSVGDLAARSGASKSALNALASAGALAGLTGHRREQRWATLGVERLPGLLAGRSAAERTPVLRRASEGQEIAADYRSLRLTLGRHPLALLRARLDRLRVLRSSELPRTGHGARVRVAGLVTHRQRPEAANGVMFCSLEDEDGIANIIFWPSVQLSQRQAVLGARLMLVEGQLQVQDGVTNVVAERIRDATSWLGHLSVESRNFC